MRTVIRNSFARESIRAERVRVYTVNGPTCTECGSRRESKGDQGLNGRMWLYRFHVDGETARTSGPIADGKLFCSRDCAEAYIGHSFDEGKR